MALASIPASATDGSTSPVDAYVLEIYRQAAEATRPATATRFPGLGAFLAVLGVLTAALAMLFSVPEGASDPLILAASMSIGVVGLVVSMLFYVLEIHRTKAFVGEAGFDGPIDATSSIYQASIGFFGFAIAIATALLLVR